MSDLGYGDAHREIWNRRDQEKEIELEILLGEDFQFDLNTTQD